jgi:hypothetical protein
VGVAVVAEVATAVVGAADATDTKPQLFVRL